MAHTYFHAVQARLEKISLILFPAVTYTMIKTVDHFLASSLKEFLNHRCLKDLQAFTTVSGTLTQYTDPKWRDKTAIGSSYASFVYDASIPGATVATGLPGVPDVIVDYKNGRFLAPTGTVATGLSATFSVNDINFYVSSDPDAKLIFKEKYLVNPSLKAATAPLPPKSYIAPCVFVKSYRSENSDHCLGGETEAHINFRVIAMMKTEAQLLGFQHVVRNCRQDIFPLILGSVMNQYNSLNTPGWSYQAEMDYMTDYALVEDSSFKIQELDVFTDDQPNMYVGIGNIEVSYFASPMSSVGNPIDFEGDTILDLDGDLLTA